MRKMQKKQAEEFVSLLSEAHDEIKRVIGLREYDAALALLEQCQEGAIRLGELIEATEGEGFVTIPLLEHYCELVYELHEEIAQNRLRNADEYGIILMEALDVIRESVKRDIRARLEVVFLPYKASMWDSLESVWKAADTDEGCDAYVVPIPYYDRNPDMSFGQLHYEGHKFPKGVPVTFYQDYDMEKRRPDVIYIHNPYDEYNVVTSVAPEYYSYELKKYTETLVYIPYYSTTGGMSEGQRRCSAYYHADYIVTQAEKYRKFFDEEIPDEKFLPFGSPKFDRVIHTCENPPEPPEDWKVKMEGKKVCFYNTSIGGMLENTGEFLKKMKYVFECFEKNPQACLLWRPHPLLESTMESMRPGYLEVYRALKDYFLERELGIYDTTPDITNVVAWSDVYIGEAGSSVVSLFGIAGKPIFLLNNQIHTEPEEDDWRGIIRGYGTNNSNNWMITRYNQLYGAVKGDFTYRYYGDLSEYAGGWYYNQVISMAGKEYVCPANAQDIIVLNKGKIEKRIKLEQYLEQPGAFYETVGDERYLFLIPNYYPYLVRYDTWTEELSYIDIGQYGVKSIEEVNGVRCVGGSCVQGEYLFMASAADDYVLAVKVDTLEVQVLRTGAHTGTGSMKVISDGTDLWFLPYELAPVVRWNPFTGKAQEYADYPAGIVCEYMLHGRTCYERPFNSMAFTEKAIYIAPYWANMHLCLDKKTGKMTEWKPPFEVVQREKNEYFYATGRGAYLPPDEQQAADVWIYFSVLDRKLYEMDFASGTCKELFISFDERELKEHAPAFHKESQWIAYACVESAFHALPDVLKGELTKHDREEQIHTYDDIAANHDGTCGQKIHDYICRHIKGEG